MSNRKLPISLLTSEERDDFGYHDPQANRLISFLTARTETCTLGDCLELIYRYPTFYGLQYVDEGVRVVKGETIVDGQLAESDEADFITEEDASRFPRTILEENDLVMGVRGTVGKVAVVTPAFSGSIINANLIRLKLKDSVDPFYLHAYLSSRVGQTLIERQSTKAVQSTITVPYIKAVPIWLPKDKETQRKIAQPLLDAYRERSGLLKKAEEVGLGIGEYVLDTLGATLLPPKDQWRYKLTISSLQRRDDPEYYSPNRYDTIAAIRRLSYKRKKLGEVAPITNNRINPQQHPEHIFHYLSLANVQSHTGELTGDTVVAGEDILSQSNYFEEGDILFGRLRPYLNKVYFAEGKVSEGICSTEFYVLRPTEEVEGLFLAYYLLSPLILNQTKYAMAGSSLPRLPKQDFQELEVPLVPQQIQRAAIAEIIKRRGLIREYLQQAASVIDTAKKEVEKSILGEGFIFDEDVKVNSILIPSPLPLVSREASAQQLGLPQ